MEWNYNEPPEIKGIKWYEVLMIDGRICKACWWEIHWYCFAEWLDIKAWKEI